MNSSTEVLADFKAYQDRVTSSLMNVTKNATSIASYDLSFHRSLSDQVSRSLDAQNAHLLRLTNKLLKAATRETNVKAPNIPNRDGVDDKWREVVDVFDDLLEKADANLDEYSGGITRITPQPSTPEPSAAYPRTSTYRPSPYSVIPKPQLQFSRKVDNFLTGPWKPLLRTKPHAKIPLEDSIGSEETGYHHPYAHEVQVYQYPSHVYLEAAPTAFTPPENDEPIWVDTEEGVLQMLQELRQAKEIAIDLEHNDRNSYIGLVSLMQISTRTRDWVVDTLKPWRENLQVLNHVFADPSILKVFHGSTSDMIWLQRDLGLYVVGLFDTYHAANVLNYPYRSLAYLLGRFANFQAQKQHQMADWRVRPLPQELLDYARSDTHYLLYIYDNLRNELVQQSTSGNSLIDYVLENSKKECLQVYERHPYDRENGLGPDGWLKLFLTRSTKTLDKQQFGILKCLHEWRDKKARELDEGVHSIMSNNFLWNCAEFKPESQFKLFGNRQLGRCSPYVEKHPEEVINVIKSGKREGADGPTVQEVMDRNADKLATFRQFKHANPHAKPQEVQQSVAATMQKLVQSGEIRNGVVPNSNDTSEPLVGRVSSSLLWGSTQTDTLSPVMNLEAARVALDSIMPLRSYAGEVKTSTVASPETNGTKTEGDTTIPLNGNSEVAHVPDVDVPFILRDRKKKRTVDELEADSHVASDPAEDLIDLSTPDENKVLTSKQARKALKKARKEAAAQAVATEFKPFDYANAQSILHATDQPGSLKTYQGPNPTKPFNPFAKALDTSTGAKRNRMGKELAGKSHTFKS